MDFDYQHMKDAENIQREERIGALFPQLQKPLTQQLSVHEPLSRQSPPIKPRRSLKLPKTSQTQCLQIKKVSPTQGLGPLQPLSPALRAQTLLWFQKTQVPRLSRPGLPLPSWLHGFATRREAENILKDKPQGCFLLRLSESKIGFVLSYRGKDRCRHFIIEEEEGRTNGRGGSYLITGEDSRHGSLSELVSYYTQNPVGPYDEMLTTPCDESNKVSQEIIKQWGHHRSGIAEAPRGDYGDYKATNLLSSPKPLISETELNPLTSSTHTDKDFTAEYAIVKKVLRKSHSLPESQLSELAGHSLEAPNMNLSSQANLPQSDTGCAGAWGGEDSIDVQYAKVRKPPKVVPQTKASPYVNINNLQVHQRAPVPTAPLTHGLAGDPGNRQLERMHTYEKTPYLFQQEKAEQQMDINSMGPGKDDQRRADSQHHLYSEVNLHGRRECSSHIPFTERATPSLPSRPPPSRAINTHPHPDSRVQRSGETLLLSSSPSQTGNPQPPYSERPLTCDPGASIYEQISERPISSRPPLPPPNPKRA
ncbi:SH2 domain-containing protein 2A [Osmerus mordax]|uniref:SH2 domain-containing protein 2A n=1 Tax=Osmerus mordax TaxID=8014 RepID=UPI003510202B